MNQMLLLLLLAAAPQQPADEAPAGSRLIVRPEAFGTLVNPQCSHCRDEAKRRADALRADERALCWIRGYSDGGVIPMRFFLNSFRVISDSYGVFVYDPDAGFARGFAPSYDFAFHGWRNGVMVMKHKDGTLYSALTGIAFAGPNLGKRLQPVPTLVSTWGYALDRYPGAVAYHMFDKYQPVELPEKVSGDSVKSRIRTDSRLPAEALVFGVAQGKNARAYTVEKLARTRLLSETIAGQERVVLWYEPTKTAAAFRPLATPPKKDAGTPRTVTLALDNQVATAPFVDKETGSHWDITGRAVDGALAGWTLEWLDGVQVRWFAWAAEYPATSIFKATE